MKKEVLLCLPLYIVLEGVDSCGKTTQSRMLADVLGATLTREPGSTGIGQRLREILLDPSNSAITSLTELLLMNADRVQNLSEIVSPSLASGRSVISDRSFVSTLAYQGIVRGLGFDLALQVCEIAIEEVRPDLVILLDIDMEQVRARRGRGQHDSTDRFEQEKDEFREKLIIAYREVTQRVPGIRFVWVDARGTTNEVHTSILGVVKKLQKELDNG